MIRSKNYAADAAPSRTGDAALDTNETWVAVNDHRITGFVNIICDHAELSGEI